MYKQLKNRGVLFASAVGLLAIVALVQCFSEPGNGEPVTWYPDFETPFQCLSNLLYTYEHYRDEPNIIDKYKLVLDPQYVFYFDPEDVGTWVGDYQIPTSWTYEEDWRATKNMFNLAHSIALDIPILNQGEEYFGTPADDATVFPRNNVTINLLLMVDESNGFQATGFCDFEFAKNENGEWHLIVWWDRTASG